MYSKGDEQDEAAEEEESDGEPSTTRTRRTQPEADIHDEKTVCLNALEDVNDVRMFSCAFEDFSKRPDIESLFGKVALVLTDPHHTTQDVKLGRVTTITTSSLYPS
jgi:hypothetical protein